MKNLHPPILAYFLSENFFLALSLNKHLQADATERSNATQSVKVDRCNDFLSEKN